MKKTPLELMALDAKAGIEYLKKLRQLYKMGKLSRGAVEGLAGRSIASYDRYGHALAKKHKVSYKRFSLPAFLR